HYVALDLIGTGTADVTAYLVHGEYHSFPKTLDPAKHPEYAKIGTYHIDYDKKTVTAKSEDIAGAFRKVARTSKPDDIYEIPDFIGMTWAQALNAVEESPLDLSLYKKLVDSDKPEGTVVAQTLEPGTEASTKPGLVNKVIELSVSAGAKKEIRFVLPHRNGLESYPFLDYPFMVDETYIPTPLSGIEAYLYELDANGKRTGKAESTREDFYFTEIFWGTGVKDYEVILRNSFTGEEAKAGTYRFDFGSQTYQLTSGDVDAAFSALTSPLPELVGKSWKDASAAAEKAGIQLAKVTVSNGAPAGTIVYQPFETGEQITKGNTVPVEVSDGNGDLTPISFELTIPAGYTGDYTVIGFKQDDDASYTTPFLEFDAAEANGSIQITMSGYGEGDFIMTLVKDGDSAKLGVLHINFEKQTVEIIEDNTDAAFRQLNT
ncbi:MAG: PASTA domain-containing protein, partial [Oscillospiraceae bacterium]|nr:PASTA domain-containing protein [Oscillospiraceae bacterium]